MKLYLPILIKKRKLKNLSQYPKMDEWMDDLQFYILLNSISGISGQWADENERLCAMEPIDG